jgi:hypothetical protein
MKIKRLELCSLGVKSGGCWSALREPLDGFLQHGFGFNAEPRRGAPCRGPHGDPQALRDGDRHRHCERHVAGRGMPRVPAHLIDQCLRKGYDVFGSSEADNLASGKRRPPARVPGRDNVQSPRVPANRAEDVDRDSRGSAVASPPHWSRALVGREIPRRRSLPTRTPSWTSGGERQTPASCLDGNAKALARNVAHSSVSGDEILTHYVYRSRGSRDSNE